MGRVHSRTNAYTRSYGTEFAKSSIADLTAILYVYIVIKPAVVKYYIIIYSIEIANSSIGKVTEMSDAEIFTLILL